MFRLFSVGVSSFIVSAAITIIFRNKPNLAALLGEALYSLAIPACWLVVAINLWVFIAEVIDGTRR